MSSYFFAHFFELSFIYYGIFLHFDRFISLPFVLIEFLNNTYKQFLKKYSIIQWISLFSLPWIWENKNSKLLRFFLIYLVLSKFNEWSKIKWQKCSTSHFFVHLWAIFPIIGIPSLDRFIFLLFLLIEFFLSIFLDRSFRRSNSFSSSLFIIEFA